MSAKYYVVTFIPESKFGTISKKTYSKKHAYEMYHKLKEEIGEIRPGYLQVVEILENDQERYVCRYKTGRNRDGKALIDRIKKDIKMLKKLYNQDYLTDMVSATSKEISNMTHGLEIVDTTLVNEEDLYKYVFDKLEIVNMLRRQYKTDLHDATQIYETLNALFTNADKIAKALSNMKQYRLVADTKKLNPAQIAYLESLGIDTDAYIGKNVTPEDVLPLSKLVEPIKVNKRDDK